MHKIFQYYTLYQSVHFIHRCLSVSPFSIPHPLAILKLLLKISFKFLLSLGICYFP